MKTKGTKKYALISAWYNYDDNGNVKTATQNAFCESEAGSSAVVPTMGYLLDEIRKSCEKHGYKYVEGSYMILNVISLTKADFDNLNNKSTKV